MLVASLGSIFAAQACRRLRAARRAVRMIAPPAVRSPIRTPIVPVLIPAFIVHPAARARPVRRAPVPRAPAATRAATTSLVRALRRARVHPALVRRWRA